MQLYIKSGCDGWTFRVRIKTDPSEPIFLKRHTKSNCNFFRYGALDAKIASKASFPSLNFVAEAGPTHDNHAPFSWSKTNIPEKKPTFLPIDTFNFSHIETAWGLNSGSVPELR